VCLPSDGAADEKRFEHIRLKPGDEHSHAKSSSPAEGSQLV